VWKDFQTRFKRLLEGLGRHRDFIQSQADLLHYHQYKVDRTRYLEDIDRQEQQEQKEKYSAVLKWLSGANTSLDHADACSARQEYPGTGRWILKTEKLQNWREAQFPIYSSLWINGIPGAGKTILASVIIDDCLQDKRLETIYFYCKQIIYSIFSFYYQLSNHLTTFFINGSNINMVINSYFLINLFHDILK